MNEGRRREEGGGKEGVGMADRSKVGEDGGRYCRENVCTYR